MLAALIVATTWAGQASAISGKQPLVVVLCKFVDQTGEPHPLQYYEDMFTETGAGQQGVFDFWRDVSYGSLDLTGSVVKGWYTSPMKVADFNVANRNVQIDTCASQAVNDVDFSKFAGVIVLTNHTNFNGPLFGAEPPTTIAGTTYNNLGRAAAEEDQHLNGIQHESGHSLRMKHSRAITNDPTVQIDYGDTYDVMSCLGCSGTSTYSYQGIGGPGLNAVQVITAGWMPGNRLLEIGGDACTQQTIQLAALNHPQVPGYLAARIPAAVPIFANLPGATTGDYYTVSMRHPSNWDEGIGSSGVLINLHGQDTYAYFVNAAGAWGSYIGSALMGPGDAYVDAASQNLYVAVNAIDDDARTAFVTIGARKPGATGVCKLDASIAYSGPGKGDFNDVVTLTADLVASGSTAPVPNVTVSFKLGTQGCAATTDAKGRATCGIRLTQFPGAYNVSAAFAGNAAYDPVETSAGFTITGRILQSLTEAELWVGLRNSDDQGTQFDLMVELLRNGTPVAQGLTRCITGITRNPSFAKKAVVQWGPLAPLPMSSRDTLAIRISTRVGTTEAGAKCAGPGGSHTSAVGLRLYYDGSAQPSGFGAAIAPSPPNPTGDLSLHSNGTVCPAGGFQSSGVTARTVDGTAPAGAASKCADSGVVNFAGANPFAVIGTWNVTLP